MERMIDLLLEGEKGKYAIPAINVSNMETVNGLFEVAEKMKAPVIVQIAPIQLKMQNISYRYFVDLVLASAKVYDVRFAIHLDHGENEEQLHYAVDAGFSSVMFDGSGYETDENIRKTQIARKISGENVTLEGEIGRLAGQEGGGSSDAESFYTDPKEALRFVQETNVDCLAVSIGNAHGFYKGVPMLNLDILEQIYDATKIPLVMHGASGLNEKDLHNAIKRGIVKINFFTAVDHEFTKGILSEINSKPDSYMMSYIEKGRQSMMREIEKIINICGSENKM